MKWPFLKTVSISILSLLLFSGCMTKKSRIAKEESMKKAELWLYYLDNGQGNYFWEVTADVTQDMVSKDDFIKYYNGRRKPLGKVIERKFQYNWKLDSYHLALPDGEYRIVNYWTEFEFRDHTEEYIILTRQTDGQWKVLQWGIDKRMKYLFRF